MEDLAKKIEQLEKRIKELESKNNDNLSIFGRSYSQIGNSNSDILLKTKGQVKIQWGNKFIDLLKDGKINSDSSFIFKASDTSKIGVKDGIYVLEDQSIYLKIGSSLINLVGETGSTFVSFMEGQITSPDAKHNAMVNIGFLHKSLQDVDSTSLQNGVIYIESEQKFYIVKDGSLSEFKVSIPNPFTEQFIIQKNDNSKGSLVIKGSGIENSISFDSFQIYEEYDNCVINSNNSFVIKIGDSNKVTIEESLVKVGTDLVADMIKSKSASSTNGFRLYTVNSNSVLEVDRIIERNPQNSEILYPEYWLLNNRIIKQITPYYPESETEETENDNNLIEELDITLFQESTYIIGDVLYIYIPEYIEEPTGKVDDGIEITNTRVLYTKVELEITSTSDNGTILHVKCSKGLTQDTVEKLTNQFIFLIKSVDNQLPIRLKSNNIDIVEYGNSSRGETIKTRIGDLSKIQDGENALSGFGIYTDNLRLGGTRKEDFPKYTKTLNDLVSNIDINSSDEYNCVLVSVGLVKQVLRDNQEAIDQLKQKIEILETEISSIKEQLESQNT